MERLQPCHVIRINQSVISIMIVFMKLPSQIPHVTTTWLKKEISKVVIGTSQERLKFHIVC